MKETTGLSSKRETISVPFDGLVQRSGFDAIRLCRTRAQQYLFSSNQEDLSTDSFGCYDSNGTWHVHPGLGDSYT